MAIASGSGIEADLDPLVEERGGSGESCLFGEGPGGIVLAASEADASAIVERADAAGVEALGIGAVGGETIAISAAERDVSVPIADAERAWRSLGDEL
jgi:phosphoribosylformylglycinamidine (FGAM) synthase-like enzyme